MTTIAETATEDTFEDPWEATRPKRLSPSRASDFRQCPRMYEAKVVHKVADPPTMAQAVGVLVHQVLEDMFGWPPHMRTLDAAVAHIPAAWEATVADEGRGYGPEAIAGWGTTVEGIHDQAEKKITTYFTLEDPTALTWTETEQELTGIVSGVPIIGFVDRQDIAADANGEVLIRVVDYKSGDVKKAGYQADALWQLLFYSWVIYRQTGVLPRLVRLMYLGDKPGFIQRSPTVEQIEAFEREAQEMWTQIMRAYDRNEWTAKPSVLCSWCPLFDVCDAEGKPTKRHRKWKPATVAAKG